MRPVNATLRPLNELRENLAGVIRRPVVTREQNIIDA